VNLDLKYRKFIKLADIKGNIKVNIISEGFVKLFLEDKINEFIKELKEKGLKGTITIDDDIYIL